MIRLTIALAICFFCVLGATAQEEIDSHTIRPCEGWSCSDNYEPVCVFDKKYNCYLTIQNMCRVSGLWCDYGPLAIFKESECTKDLPACDLLRYVSKTEIKN
uniref:Kazal-like domain-containing protein n=1 Tax=Megaselia scalaris TaxID=36166 RepID=T1H380_MEGSC